MLKARRICASFLPIAVAQRTVLTLDWPKNRFQCTIKIMRRFKYTVALPALVLVLISTKVLSADNPKSTRAEQELFATKILALINDNKLEYAKAVTEKYLEIEPHAGPVNRVMARYYMKTGAELNGSLLGHRYPDPIASKITEFLYKAVASDPDDAQAWSLLVYTHASQGDIALGEDALIKARSMEEEPDWLQFNSAMLALADNDLPEAMNRLAPITINGIVPDGSDSESIQRNAWLTQQKIALHDPSVDPLNVVREGLVTRVDVKQIPEHLVNVNNTESAKPVLFLFSSQETGCTYCIPDFDRFSLVAGYNKEKGSPIDIVYASLEPWSDVKYYSPMLRGMGVRGAPHYSIIHNGYHYEVTKDGNDRVDYLRDFIDNPEELLAVWEPKLNVLPRADFFHDQLFERFARYKSHNRDGFQAMAYALSNTHWHAESVFSASSQDTADKSALAACNSKINTNHYPDGCKIYARAKNQVDADALQRTALKNEQINQLRAERLERQTVKNERDKQKREEQAAAPAKVVKQETNNEVQQGDSRLAGKAIKQYEQNNDHYKALALAQDPSASVVGLATKQLTQGGAVKSAMEQCEAARVEQGVNAECLLYSIGKKIVDDQSPEGIAKLVAKQQKRNVKNSALDASYKKYRKFSTDKAYAYSEDNNGDWVYGMGFGKRGAEKASAAALEECEAKRAEKSLVTPCQILILNSKFVDLP